MVRTVNMTFNDDDFATLKERKGEQSWEQYILILAGLRPLPREWWNEKKRGKKK